MMPKEMTVFYTDDDEEDREFFKEITDTISSDLTLVTHDNGRDLLELLNNPPPNPHVLFLDLNMPGLNGFDVLERVRENHSLRALPIVIFTTSKDVALIEKSREMGANYFVQKSGHFLSLKKSIEFALNIDWSTFDPGINNFVYSAKV